jgi:thiamine kinase-like enzyme
MALGFGPDVITFLEPEQYLVTRFVEGRPVPRDELLTTEVLGQLARDLRSFHDTAAFAHRFDAFRVPFDHRDAAAARGVPIPAAFDNAASVLAEIERAWTVHPDPPCPCHDDLLNANLLRRSDGRLVLLDWEYAGTNDRYFDLGNLAVNNGLGEADEAALLAAYLGAPPTAAQAAALRLMRLMSDVREAMWAVVQQVVSDLDFDYGAYAAEHFARLRTGAEDPRLEEWIHAASA